MLRYIFLLGRETALNAAEVVATGRFESFDVSASNSDVLVAETATPLDDAQVFLDHLGGTIKIARVVGMVETRRASSVHASDLLPFLSSVQGKLSFGISVYGSGAGRINISSLGHELKRLLSERSSAGQDKQSARFVSSQVNPLSSVIVRTQKLLGARGCELIVVANDSSHLTIAVTIAAQNFIEYGRRDAGRPSRNINRGMLPPKVAQILLNLACLHPGDTVLDPFCGTGTILQEALMLGAGKVIGRDSDASAITESETNLAWLKSRVTAPVGAWEVYQHDARQPDPRLKSESVDVIATETYLGPLRPPRRLEQQRALMAELGLLYRQSITQMATCLKPGGRIAMIVPVIGTQSAASLTAMQNFSPLKLQTINILPPALAQRFGISLGQPLVYQRPGQTVGRAVVVLEKIL
jgi:tRNA (guanine10-N2)-dimethyltransferase